MKDAIDDATKTTQELINVQKYVENHLNESIGHQGSIEKDLNRAKDMIERKLNEILKSSRLFLVKV